MCTTSTSSKIVEQACRQPSCSGNCSSSPPRMLGAAKKPCFKAAPRSRLPPCKQVALVKQLVRSTVATCPGLAAGTVAKLRRVVSQGGQPEQFVYAQLLEVPGAKQALVGLLDLETSTVEVVLDALALLHNGPCIGGSEDLKDGLVDVGVIVESQHEVVAADAAGTLSLIVRVNPNDRCRGYQRIRRVIEAGAVPALYSKLSKGPQSIAAIHSSEALIQITGATSINWPVALLKWFIGLPVPRQFPALIDAIRAMSESYTRGMIGARASAELQSRTSVPSSDSTQAVHAQLLAPTALAALVTEVPRLEIPRMKIPRLEVPRPEVSSCSNFVRFVVHFVERDGDHGDAGCDD